MRGSEQGGAFWGQAIIWRHIFNLTLRNNLLWESIHNTRLCIQEKASAKCRPFRSYPFHIYDWPMSQAMAEDFTYVTRLPSQAKSLLIYKWKTGTRLQCVHVPCIVCTVYYILYAHNLCFTFLGCGYIVVLVESYDSLWLHYDYKLAHWA